MGDSQSGRGPDGQQEGMRPRAVRMMKRLREGCNARALAPASCGAAQQR